MFLTFARISAIFIAGGGEDARSNGAQQKLGSFLRVALRT